jgi:hypothetical protein
VMVVMVMVMVIDGD